MTADKRDSVAVEWPSTSGASCEVITGTFTWGVQRCDKPGYMMLNVDGDPWTICYEHYEAAR